MLSLGAKKETVGVCGLMTTQLKNIYPVIVTNDGAYRVECGNPNCPVITRTHWKLDMLEVVKDWNTRA